MGGLFARVRINVAPEKSLVDNVIDSDIIADMTTKELIRLLGGVPEVARIFGVKETSVRNWSSENAIPQKHHLRLFRECARRGIAFDPEKPSEAA
jgi:hypothetical protein